MRFKAADFHVDPNDPFLNDRFERKPIVEFLADIVGKSGGPFVMAIDSPWGTGKTATVQMLKAYLEKEGYVCVYFDAWRADYVSDPLVAMLGTLDQLNFSKSPVAKHHFDAAKRLAGSLGRRLLISAVRAGTAGLVDIKDYEGLADELASGAAEDVVDAFNEEQGALAEIRKELGKAVAKMQSAGKGKKTLVFFIDELDRCRPDYALAVLERIKHLFDLANIHFLLSVDKAQLESSVGAVHGEKINSSEYLRRFFDLEFSLPDGDSEKYTEFLIESFGLDRYFEKRTGEIARDGEYFVKCFSSIASVFSLNLRARERCLTRLAVVASQTKPNQYLDPELTSFLIILRLIDKSFFNDLAAGKLSTEKVSDFIRSKPEGDRFMNSHMGAVLYGLLILHHSNKDVYVRESLELRGKCDFAASRSDYTGDSWLETAVAVMENQSARHRQRLIRDMAGKIDLTSRLNM